MGRGLAVAICEVELRVVADRAANGEGEADQSEPAEVLSVSHGYPFSKLQATSENPNRRRAVRDSRRLSGHTSHDEAGGASPDRAQSGTISLAAEAKEPTHERTFVFSTSVLDRQNPLSSPLFFTKIDQIAKGIERTWKGLDEISLALLNIPYGKHDDDGPLGRGARPGELNTEVLQRGRARSRPQLQP